MRRSRLLLLFVVMTLLPFSVGRSDAAGQLHVTMYTDKQTYGPTEVVSIGGQVLDDTATGVPFASVSVQTNDPNGNPTHVALTLSSIDGSYSDQFTVPSNAAQGGYTFYATASKPGYADGNIQITCIITPEFPFSDISFLMLLPVILLVLIRKRREKSLISEETKDR